MFNRRYLETRLRELFDRPAQTKSSFGILFIDLDGFKLLNDRHGHLFGDFVLQQVADCLNRQMRQGDIVARYGGDEFCLLFEPMDERGVQSFAHRAWERINDLDFTGLASRPRGCINRRRLLRCDIELEHAHTRCSPPPTRLCIKRNARQKSRRLHGLPLRPAGTASLR